MGTNVVFSAANTSVRIETSDSAIYRISVERPGFVSEKVSVHIGSIRKEKDVITLVAIPFNAPKLRHFLETKFIPRWLDLYSESVRVGANSSGALESGLATPVSYAGDSRVRPPSAPIFETPVPHRPMTQRPQSLTMTREHLDMQFRRQNTSPIPAADSLAATGEFFDSAPSPAAQIRRSVSSDQHILRTRPESSGSGSGNVLSVAPISDSTVREHVHMRALGLMAQVGGASRNMMDSSLQAGTASFTATAAAGAMSRMPSNTPERRRLLPKFGSVRK